MAMRFSVARSRIRLLEVSLFVSPCEDNTIVAELLAARFGLPQWRFTNSGTEATMDAIRVARGVTGRHRIVKVEGGYHGHHDAVLVSTKPVRRRRRRPQPSHVLSPQRLGLPPGVLADTAVVSFNDPDALEHALSAGDVACFIVEPVMENIGICLPARRIPSSRSRDHKAVWHAAGVRRGQDRHHRKLARRRCTLWCGPRPACGRQVHWRRPAARRIRRIRGVHGRHHDRESPPRRHVQRQSALHGRSSGGAGRDLHAGGNRAASSSATGRFVADCQALLVGA